MEKEKEKVEKEKENIEKESTKLRKQLQEQKDTVRHIFNDTRLIYTFLKVAKLEASHKALKKSLVSLATVEEGVGPVIDETDSTEINNTE